MNIDKILSNMKDYHIPASILVFFMGSILQWCHHMDATYVAFTATVLGAITGHAFSPAEKNVETDGH